MNTLKNICIVLLGSLALVAIPVGSITGMSLLHGKSGDIETLSSIDRINPGEAVTFDCEWASSDGRQALMSANGWRRLVNLEQPVEAGKRYQVKSFNGNPKGLGAHRYLVAV